MESATSSPEVPVSLWSRFRTQVYRHRIILIVPPILFYCIYADYTHTQKWKRKQALTGTSTDKKKKPSSPPSSQ